MWTDTRTRTAQKHVHCVNGLQNPMRYLQLPELTPMASWRVRPTRWLDREKCTLGVSSLQTWYYTSIHTWVVPSFRKFSKVFASYRCRQRDLERAHLACAVNRSLLCNKDMLMLRLQTQCHGLREGCCLVLKSSVARLGAGERIRPPLIPYCTQRSPVLVVRF